MKLIDEKKRREVLQRACQAMSDVEASMASEENKKTYLEFMVRYTAIERAYKVLLRSYLQETGRKTSSRETLCIQSRDIPYVLSYFGIDLSDSDKDNVFNGKNKKGERKARGLRNSLAHRPNTDALNELDSKKNQLFASMDALVEAINAGAKEH